MYDLTEPTHQVPKLAGELNGHASNVPIVAHAHDAGLGKTMWRKAQDGATRALLWRERRAHAQDLAAAGRLMNEQLTLVSHELRNSLGTMRLATRLIELNQRHPLLVEHARVIIDRQVAHMDRLVEDLLDESLIRGGRLCLRRERVDLCVVAKHAVESVEPEISWRHQRLTLTLPEAPVWLQADPGRLAQVLVNLLGNAVKYTDVGGKLQLSVEREAGLATIRVHDSGIGIARDVLPHVFEPFMQAESSLSRSKGGVGMGLALVRGLVESHGGRVSAASAGLGHGSQFTVHLPLTLG
jgi:signal transduction histidine kinase